jgi:DNA modification methylase
LTNYLYYGDNLDVLRKYIKDQSIDLCYIDPPFNSKRNYNQIYNNIGTEDRAQAQAFVDTWTWDDHANEGFADVLGNSDGRFTAQTVDLIKGLHPVLKKGSLLAYLVSMTLRVAEIHRVLKPNGSFYLHCDPTASHYLKLLLDSVFEPTGGDFRNELIWAYKTGGVSKHWFGRKHDVVFFYTKSNNYTFNLQKEKSYLAHKYGFTNVEIFNDEGGNYTMVGMRDVWDIPALRGNQPETLGYPTQKPESLLERIIQASSNPGDTVLDAYCGCGTSTAVAQRLGRQWIGIDITYQSIALILRRLEAQFGKQVLDDIVLNGIPRDMASAKALANKKDDRVRKEFEKWAVLTYTDNRAIINQKKGADAGVDGIAYTTTGPETNAKVVLQVKSGNVQRNDIAILNSDRLREGAEMAVLITLQDSTKPMRDEAKGVGQYFHPLMQSNTDRIKIVTIKEIVEADTRLKLPLSLEVLKKAKAVVSDDQLQLMDTHESI